MDTVSQGYNIMIIGMSTVFGFLVIMIFTMNICSFILKLLNKYFPEVKEEPKRKIQNKNEDAQIALAIACAIKRERGQL